MKRKSDLDTKFCNIIILSCFAYTLSLVLNTNNVNGNNVIRIDVNKDQ
jgi:hypothetical protein